jgi:hypothetical protein
VPPGLINISNWSALVGLLTSIVALTGAASQIFKKRAQTAVTVVPQSDGAAGAAVAETPAKV